MVAIAPRVEDNSRNDHALPHGVIMDLVFLINLPLGVFWLFLGGALLVLEKNQVLTTPHPAGVPLGWWLMILSLYNFMKVGRHLWSRRQPAQPPAEMPETSLARREPLPKASEPPDPNFQFTDQPPPESKNP